MEYQEEPDLLAVAAQDIISASSAFTPELRQALGDWFEQTLLPKIQQLRPAATVNADGLGLSVFGTQSGPAMIITEELICTLNTNIQAMSQHSDTNALQVSLEALKAQASSDPCTLLEEIRQYAEMENAQYQSPPQFDQGYEAGNISNGMEAPKEVLESLKLECQDSVDTKEDIISQIAGQLAEQSDKVKIVVSEVEKFSVEQRKFCTAFMKYTQRQADAAGNQSKESTQILELELEGLRGNLDQQFASLKNGKKNIFKTLDELCNSAEHTEELVILKLNNWKKEQMMVGNGYHLDMNILEELQYCCQTLAEILMDSRQSIQHLAKLSEQSILPNQQQIATEAAADAVFLKDLESKFTDLLKILVADSFVIEKQPPQVIKTNSKVGLSSLRCLVGDVLNWKVTPDPPRVCVSVISEAQASQLDATISRGATSGALNGNSEKWEFNRLNKRLACDFRKLHLENIRRPERKAERRVTGQAAGEPSVLDEKYALLYSTELVTSDLHFELRSLSLPFTVTVHGNQEEQALSTILWDHAFAQWGRNSFEVTDEVRWEEMAKVLDMKWESYCDVKGDKGKEIIVRGTGLTEQNLYYLAVKALGQKNLPREWEVYKNVKLRHAQFSKEEFEVREKNSKREFRVKRVTFWEWFHQAMLLTAKHLKELWNKGYILGFIQKEEAASILRHCPIGTFLFRFSDSLLASISITYVLNKDGRPHIDHLEPFIGKDLEVKSLITRVNEVPQYKWLYPNMIPKEQLKEHGAVPQTVSRGAPTSGYKPWSDVTHIDDLASQMNQVEITGASESVRRRKIPRRDPSQGETSVNNISTHTSKVIVPTEGVGSHPVTQGTQNQAEIKLESPMLASAANEVPDLFNYVSAAPASPAGTGMAIKSTFQQQSSDGFTFQQQSSVGSPFQQQISVGSASQQQSSVGSSFQQQSLVGSPFQQQISVGSASQQLQSSDGSTEQQQSSDGSTEQQPSSMSTADGDGDLLLLSQGEFEVLLNDLKQEPLGDQEA